MYPGVKGQGEGWEKVIVLIAPANLCRLEVVIPRGRNSSTRNHRKKPHSALSYGCCLFTRAP